MLRYGPSFGTCIRHPCFREFKTTLSCGPESLLYIDCDQLQACLAKQDITPCRNPKQSHDRDTNFMHTRIGARYLRTVNGCRKEPGEEKTDMRAAKLICLLAESTKAGPEHGQIEVDENYSRVRKRAFEDGCGILEGVTKLSRAMRHRHRLNINTREKQEYFVRCMLVM